MTSTNEDTERKSGKIDAEKIIPASRRPDGSLRKERRVRAGYTAPEEIPVYVAPHIRARKARERAQASKNPVDADQVLSQLGRLKLDQKSPIETSTQPLDAPSPPASAQEKKEEQKKADEVQKVQKVRGRGNSSFIKHTSDFAD